MKKFFKPLYILSINKLFGIILIICSFSFLSCAISPSFIRTSEAINATTQTKALLCASFNASIKNAKFKFNKNIGVAISLKDLKLNKTVDLHISNIDTLKDKVLYIPVVPGKYRLIMIQLYKNFTDVPFEATFQGYKWKWKPGAIFKQQDEINIAAGDITYIGSYNMQADVKEIDYEDNYLLTSLTIDDKYDTAQKDLSSILGGNSINMKKKLNLLEDINNLKYEFVR